MRIGPTVAALLAATLTGCAAESQRPRAHVVDIRQFAFAPDTIEVAPGDTIRWINRDPVPHTATATDASWDSGRMEGDNEWVMVVEEGSVPGYICSYHPNMTGVLRIRK